MAVFSAFKRAREALNFGRNANKDLRPKSSPGDAISYYLVSIASVLLVISSTGFAASFAWLLGSHHSLVLGGFMVAMAIGVELAKPFAISSAFTAFREWRLLPGLALGLAGLTAILFSSTAELSLNAMTRGDLVSQRESDFARINQANQRYRRADAELGSLAASRPGAEVQAELDGLLIKPGVGGCKEINGPVTKEVCPRIAELKAELARSSRKAELLMELKAAASAQGEARSVSSADPGATALAAYLGALGVPVAADKLSLWLPLIAVLALQLGSSTSALLVQSMKPRPVDSAVPASQADGKSSGITVDMYPPSAGTRPPDKRGIAKSVSSLTDVTVLSVRKQAQLTGQSKSAVHRERQRLAAA